MPDIFVVYILQRKDMCYWPKESAKPLVKRHATPNVTTWKICPVRIFGKSYGN